MNAELTAIDVDRRGGMAGLVPGYATCAWVAVDGALPVLSPEDSHLLVRRQFVVKPSANPFDLVTQLMTAVEAGAPSVVMLHPGADGDGYPLATWVLDPLTAICERDGYALSVDFGVGASVPLLEVDEFARNAPEVPILLLGDHLEPSRGFWRLLDRCPNLLLEITPHSPHALVRDVVAHFGAHRFSFGSRGLEMPSDIVSSLPAQEREVILCTTAEVLDRRTWRDAYL